MRLRVVQQARRQTGKYWFAGIAASKLCNLHGCCLRLQLMIASKVRRLLCRSRMSCIIHLDAGLEKVLAP